MSVPPIEPCAPPPNSWNVGSRPVTAAPFERYSRRTLASCPATSISIRAAPTSRAKNGREIVMPCVGGAFSAVGVHPRHNLAAFNLRTGRLARILPDMGVSGPVEALAVSATGRIYLGGSFGRVAGRVRQE